MMLQFLIGFVLGYWITREILYNIKKACKNYGKRKNM